MREGVLNMVYRTEKESKPALEPSRNEQRERRMVRKGRRKEMVGTEGKQAACNAQEASVVRQRRRQVRDTERTALGNTCVKESQ